MLPISPSASWRSTTSARSAGSADTSSRCPRRFTLSPPCSPPSPPSALPIALGLARPEVRRPLYSGNTLAVAIIGLALYGRALWSERRPAFLYAGIATLFLAYFGAYDFIKDYQSAFEATVGAAIGYGRT